MWIVHKRLAELYSVNRNRQLTDKEMDEMAICLQANFNRAWEVAKLKNMSYLAHMTNDVEWQHELCTKLDSLTT